MPRSAFVFLALTVAAWLGASALIGYLKVSPPAQFERLHRVF